MKILHIISDLGRGGRERQLSILVNCSNKNISHEIAVLNDIDDSYINEYNLNNILRLGKGKIRRFKNIIYHVKNRNIDLIHTWGNNETIYALPAAKLLKVPLLNGSVRHGIRLKSFSHISRSFILRLSKFVLANSRAGLEANKIKINKSRHFILYNGIEDKFFVEKDIDKKETLLLDKKLPKDAIVFLSIMNFIPFKDYITPLKALAELKREGCLFIYIMVGKGKREPKIRSLIQNLKLVDNTLIISNNTVSELTAVSDILIHSSLGEGCSNAILEAKAGGLIIAASDTGGTKEIIDENDFLFQYQNKEALKISLKSAINSLRTNKDISKEIKQRTRQKFSIENYVKGYKEIINKVKNYSN